MRRSHAIALVAADPVVRPARTVPGDPSSCWICCISGDHFECGPAVPSGSSILFEGSRLEIHELAMVRAVIETARIQPVSTGGVNVFSIGF